MNGLKSLVKHLLYKHNKSITDINKLLEDKNDDVDTNNALNSIKESIGAMKVLKVISNYIKLENNG